MAKSEGNREVDSDDKKLDDNDIEQLLDAATGSDTPAGSEETPSARADSGSSADDLSVEDRANQLLNEVDAGLEAAVAGTPRSTAASRQNLDDARPFEFADLSSDSDSSPEKAFSIGMLDDVQMSVQIELGRAELLIDEVLSMRKGVVVPLDKLAGDPIDIVVNGRLLARGEVLVLNDKFCVRVVEIVAAD